MGISVLTSSAWQHFMSDGNYVPTQPLSTGCHGAPGNSHLEGMQTAPVVHILPDLVIVLYLDPVIEGLPGRNAGHGEPSKPKITNQTLPSILQERTLAIYEPFKQPSEAFKEIQFSEFFHFLMHQRHPPAQMPL